MRRFRDTGDRAGRPSAAFPPISVPSAGPSVLAVGADLKSVPCFIHSGEARFGPEIGDLADADAAERLRSALDTLCREQGVEPALVVHDLHPDYHGTRVAAALGRSTLAVQHHHAHALACLAENGHDGPALALTLDGAGLGADGTIWGGELLHVDGPTFRRVSHLTPLAQPGGDRAAREPWRMAIAALAAVGELGTRAPPWHPSPDQAPLALLAAANPAVVEGVIALASRPGASPITTSAGRWFDAVSSLLGLVHVNRTEAEAAVALERSAAEADHGAELPIAWIEPTRHTSGQIDLRPTVAGILDGLGAGEPTSRLARGFHDTLADALIRAAVCAAECGGPGTVALTGGVMSNRLLAQRLGTGLARAGLRPLLHRRLPPGDSSLALGQAWAGVLQSRKR